MKYLFLFYYNLVEDIWHLIRLKIFFNKKVKLNKPICFDIGTHKGKFLKLFNNIYKNSVFYCFEPNFENYKYLTNHFFSKRFRFFNLAVGNKNQKKKMTVNPIDLTNTLSKTNLNSNYLKFKNFILSIKKKERIIESQEIKVVKLDTFCFKKSIKKINILKIDVEGFELQVLQGASKILNNTDYILIEIQDNKMYLNYSKKKIEKFLLRKKFKLIKKFKFPLMFFEDRVYKKTFN